MLSVTKTLIKEAYPDAIVSLYGQEVNEQAFAIAKSDLLISGDNPGNIRHGNTLIDDRHEGRKVPLPTCQSSLRGHMETREAISSMRTSPGASPTSPA